MDLVPALHSRTHRANAPILEPVSKIGGRPVLFEDIDPPRCALCGWHMDFLAQLRLDSPLTLSERWTMVYVYMCRAEPSHGGPLTCDNFEPGYGANQLMFQADSGERFVGTLPAFRPDYWIEFDEAQEPDLDTDAADFHPALRDAVLFRSRVGGVPGWAQASVEPACDGCGGPTRFVAQIHDELEPWRKPNDRGLFLGFGDCGTGYVFMCEHECSAYGGAFLWQC